MLFQHNNHSTNNIFISTLLWLWWTLPAIKDGENFKRAASFVAWEPWWWEKFPVESDGKHNNFMHIVTFGKHFNEQDLFTLSTDLMEVSTLAAHFVIISAGHIATRFFQETKWHVVTNGTFICGKQSAKNPFMRTVLVFSLYIALLRGDSRGNLYAFCESHFVTSNLLITSHWHLWLEPAERLWTSLSQANYEAMRKAK